MSLDQVVNADEVEQLQSDDEDEVFFQDIDVLQNHGIVSQSLVHMKVLFKSGKHLSRQISVPNLCSFQLHTFCFVFSGFSAILAGATIFQKQIKQCRPWKNLI